MGWPLFLIYLFELNVYRDFRMAYIFVYIGTLGHIPSSQKPNLSLVINIDVKLTES